ncbi:MAG TPA: LysR family transcriptional regulator [Steroidobacter sp.]|jgi:DNA-binding transcriptional LysR family regulator|nr:LysR family transcriptional regulator [Steroidobacter sp.]
MLPVTIRQLQIFSSVARHLSFARAAEELHLTAPAVSMQIKQLESIVRLPLFDRSSSAVSLTLTGEYFLVHVQRVLAALREAENLLGKLRRVQTGVLQLGMLTTAKYFAPHLIAAFMKEHPGVQPRLVEGNRQELVDALHRNELDLAIMGRPPKELDTRAEAFAPHPLGIIASAEHPLARASEVPVAELAREPFIIREPGSGSRLTLEALFREWRITPLVLMQMTSNESIKQAVMANLGIAFISLHTVAEELHAGKLVSLPVDQLPLMRQWQVVHLSARVLSPVAEAFRNYVLERGEDFLERHFKPPAAFTDSAAPPSA